jgi:predicted Ser/Thr protein kinase
MELAARPSGGEEPIQAATGVPRPVTPPPRPEDLAPLFPELEIEAPLGVGGMGAVYRARQKRLGRAVALKVLHRELSGDPVFVERFLREAQALAKLAHPGIVAVHDFGERAGRCYLVMEHVEGRNLRALLKERALTAHETLDVVRQLCVALQFAHDEGVVHRDIKPENVLVDRAGRVKIADFGLAKLVGAAAQVTLTDAGQVMGTPHYMAPEQIERPRDVDHRADLFSLGVVFYEMLTGELPLGRFAPPSQRVQVDVRLDQIVLRTLERERERRYQSAVEVRSDVEAVERDPAAAPAGVEERFDAVLDAVGDALDAAAEKRPRFYLHLDLTTSQPGWFVIVLLAWVLAGVAFDLGPWVLAGMGWALLGLFFALARWQARRGAPEEPGRLWRQRIDAGGLVALGFGALFLAHIASFERGTMHYAARFQRPAEGLDLGWRHNDGLLARVGLARSGTSAVVEMDSGHLLGNPYVLFDIHPLAHVTVSVALLVLAAFVLQARPWREFRAGLPAAGRAVGLWFGALALVHFLTVVLHGFDRSMVSVAASSTREGTAEAVSDALYRELIERGFAVHAEHHGRLIDVPSGADLARLVVLKAAPGSPLERWDLTWKGPRRRQPHLVLRVVSDLAGERAAVEVDGGLVDQEGPEEGRWRTWIEELLADAQGTPAGG